MPTPTHRQFIAAVHRRLAIARTLDGLAVCLAWAAAVAALTLPPARWAGVPPAIVAVPLAAAALLATAMRAAKRWPTPALAAAATDRQFAWDDLLGTAVTTLTSTDPFAVAVRAAADARCGTVHPSDVPVARLRRGAWAAVAIAVCAAAVAARVPIRFASGNADRADAANAAALMAEADAPASPPTDPARPPRRAGDDTMDVGAGSPDPATEANRSAAGTAPRPPSASRSPAATLDGGSGAAASSPHAAAPAPPGSASAGMDATAAPTAAAGGNATHPPASGTDGPAGLAATPRPCAAVPPSQLPDGPADRAAAVAAIAAGTVPPRDRELVRAYFDPAAP